MKDSLHLVSIKLHSVLSASCKQYGRIKKPPCENILSTAADVGSKQMLYR